MGSTVEQAWSRLDEQAGYAGKRGRHGDKTCATRSSGQIGRNVMGYSFTGEETARFQDYSSELLEPECHNDGKIADLR